MENDNTIKLVNKDEEAPKEFYIFQDFDSSIYDRINGNNYSLSHKMLSTAFKHCLTKQDFTSYKEGDIDYLPFIRADMSNVCKPSTFIQKTINYYDIEHNLEWYRRNNFKKYPSRFSSIFAFGDYESCKKVSQKYNSWSLSSVRKFRLFEDIKYLKEFVRIGKFNMEIVSLLRGVEISLFSREDQEILYKRYWEGKGNTSIEFLGEKSESGEIYEYLIEGMLEEVL